MHFVTRFLSSPRRASRRLGLLVTMLAAAAALGVPVALAGTVITFDELDGTGNPIVPTVASQGYTFSSAHMHLIGSPSICLFGGCTSGSLPYLAEEAGGLGKPITMTRPGGKAFELKSFSAAQNFNDDAAAAAAGFPNATAIYLVGMQAGGGQVTATVPVPDTGFASVKLKDFKKLESVTFYGNNAGNTGGFAIDDIAVG